MSDGALAIVLARAGSKGLPHKNSLPLAGKPMARWTLDHALFSSRVTRVAVSTDSPAVKQVALELGVEVVDRPPQLAHDAATVDDAARHAVLELEHRHARGDRLCRHLVLLYANVPLRPDDLTDRALEKLAATGCDSVQSVCPVGKNHPYWMKRLEGPQGDQLQMYEPNNIYRRQDLPPVYMLDGGVIAVTRDALFTTRPGEPHAFLGRDRRAVLTRPGEVVDVDDALDLAVAQALLTQKLAERAAPVALRRA
jgi:CMP-N-acetylneuraminic acid synthetase